MRLLLLVLLVVANGTALFEDQIGKFDWRIQSLGCPNNLLFGQSKAGEDFLLTSTSRNVIASVSTNSGEIVWRQLNEEATATSEPPSILLNENDLLAIINGGEYLRMFDAQTGVLKWQQRLLLNGLKTTDVVLRSRFLVLLNKNKLIALTKAGARSWTTELKSDVEWSGVFAVGKDVVVVGNKNGRLHIHSVLYSDGLETKRTFDAVAAEKFTTKNCALSGTSFVCVDGRTVHSLHLNEDATIITHFDLPDGDQASELRTLAHPDIFALKHGTQVSFVKVDKEESVRLITTNFGVAASGSRSLVAVYVEGIKKIRVFDQKSGSQVVELDVTFDIDSPVRELRLLESDNQSTFQLVLLRSDCRLDFLEGSRTEKAASLEWSRFEGLATISNVEMIDLPLSESQATIETEFSVPDATIWKSFVLRILGQIQHLRRSFTAFANQMVEAGRLLASGKESISNVVRVLIGEEANPQKRPRAGASLDESKLVLPMERDYFNLRKLIVVSTLSGSLYAVHNQYGTVVWSVYLGTQFEPLRTQLGVQSVPLFIQRTTAHYQFNSQAAVVFKLKGTSKTRVLFFNPVDGKVVNSQTFDSVKRIDLAPFHNAEMLFPLVIVDSNGKVQYSPPFPSDFRPPAPLHLFSVDLTSGIFDGFVVQHEKAAMQPAWKTKLNLGADEKIALVVGKRRNERVHSQGKVLGDREVLYKYSNPNLVAVLSVDSVHTTIVVHLIDAVSGAIVYTAKHERASNPVHLLHCENWVVYSYWNEKARRTEMGIIELYEGLEQTNAKHFNSYTTVRRPLDVITSSFVFPQGVSAIAASDTEQGLTTRSVIVAMPFGGILEVSKRLLDARRPMEMTAELREEMVLPYMPEIPIASEDLINYNQTAMQINGIRTTPSGLESTSLMFAYGLDLFYTRLTPSGTFDMLKDDFDYALISLVLVGLIVACIAFKRFSRYQTLKQAWA